MCDRLGCCCNSTSSSSGDSSNSIYMNERWVIKSHLPLLLFSFVRYGLNFQSVRRLYEDYTQNNGVHERNGDNEIGLRERRNKKRARKALNTTSNMSIKLKYSSYMFLFSYLFVCLLLLFDSYCLSFSCEHTHTQTHMLQTLRCTEHALHVCVFYVCIYMYFLFD